MAGGWERSEFRRLPKGWAQLRRRVLRRDRLCQLCFRVPAVEVDHVVARADGGSDEVSNLRGVCGECHRRVSLRQAVEGRRRQLARGRRPGVRHPGLL